MFFVRPDLAQPLFVHVDPDRILIMAGRNFAEVEFDRIQRFMDAAMIPDVFQNTVDQADDTAFASNVFRRARVAGGVFDCNHDGVADLVFAVGFVHDLPQSGRTRGISAST